MDGFCLVSSDSDFTRLAARIREQGLMAYGFGQLKTPKPFVAACTKFVYVENLGGAEDAPKPAATREATVTKAKPAATPEATVTRAKPALKGDTKLDKLLSEAVETSADDDGWAHLGAVGSNLSRLSSDFDSRSWGFAKLKDLMVAHPSYNIESRKTGDGKAPNAYVRRTQRK